MPERESKEKWARENSTKITIKFLHKGDADLLEYLGKHAKATVIKAALREYMQNHPDE